VNDGVNDRVIK